MAADGGKENEISWWENAPMTPTGTTIKQLIVDLIEKMDTTNDDEDNTVLVFPDSVTDEHLEDVFWFCETVASGCVSGGWKPTSTQDKKSKFSQAVGVSDLAFAIMVLEKHSDKWKKQGKSGRVKGEILDDCIAYYQEVADDLEKLFMGDGDAKNEAGITLKEHIARLDGWLIDKAEMHHNTGDGAYFESNQKGATRNDGSDGTGEENKKKYVVNHGIKYNPHVADMIILD